MKKTGSFRRNGSSPRKPQSQNRQGSAPGRNQNQNQNQSSGQRKGGIHPWVSSSPSSAQALTSHISMASSKNQSGASNTRKPQNGKSPYRQKRNNASNPSGPSGEKPSYQERSGRGSGRPTSRPPVETSAADVRSPSVSEKPLTGSLDAFTLFCAYHLGIGPNKEYKPSNLNEVARRFGQDPATVRQALKECGMDSASLLDRDFDMALAQLDIQVAPEGIDRMELGKSIYEDFLAAPHVKRDWKKILDEDRKENSKVFGK